MTSKRSSAAWFVPEGTQRSEQSEDSEHAQDLGPARHGHHDVNQRHEDQEAVQDVPAAAQVGLLAHIQTHGHHLEEGRNTVRPELSVPENMLCITVYFGKSLKSA